MATNFERNSGNKTYTFVQPTMFYSQASSNGTYMIYILLRHELQLIFVLCVLGQKKHPTFLRRWFQGYIENCNDFLGTSCVSRLGKEEHSESFPSLVTKLMPWGLLCFLFLCLSDCICCFFGKDRLCIIDYAILVCIVLMMDRTNAEMIVLGMCSSMW